MHQLAVKKNQSKPKGALIKPTQTKAPIHKKEQAMSIGSPRIRESVIQPAARQALQVKLSPDKQTVHNTPVIQPGNKNPQEQNQHPRLPFQIGGGKTSTSFNLQHRGNGDTARRHDSGKTEKPTIKGGISADQQLAKQNDAAIGKPERGGTDTATGVGTSIRKSRAKKSPASPDSDPGFQAVVTHIKKTAQAQAVHASAGVKSSEAQAASASPPQEILGRAQSNQVQAMEQEKPREFDKAAFKSALEEKIKSIMPSNLEEADNFKKENRVSSVKEALTAEVKAGKNQAQGGIAEKTNEIPDTSVVKPKNVNELIPESAGVAPKLVGVEHAVPPPRSESEVSLEGGSRSLETQMNEAELSDDQIRQSNEPKFQSALDSKKQAQQNAVESPGVYRKAEEGILARAEVSVQHSAEEQTAAMFGERKALFNKVTEAQHTAKGKDEQERAKVFNVVQSHYEAAKTRVTQRLEKLDQDVDNEFKKGSEISKRNFENYVELRMTNYKVARYSGINALLWVKDKLFNLPDEVNVFYEEGRKLYIKEMNIVLDAIATLVDTGLKEAKNIIVKEKQEIQNYIAGLDPSLRDVGKQAAEQIQNKFEELEQSIHEKQNSLIDTISQRYKENLEAVNSRIEEMKAENKGLVSKAFDAMKGVIETINNLRKMLLNVLARAAAAISLIIKNPIGFLGNLVSGVKQGFKNFVSNIGEHLKKGLLEWLFGALGETGIELPKSFDLKGILSLVLQILGLTYGNIRTRAVKMVGENVVSTLEKGAEIFKILITEGPAGLWEYIKEKIGDLKTQVIDQIKSFVMEKIITAGVTWILGLLNPASAFVKACKAIYDIVMFFVERGSQILALVNAIIDSITAIAKGALGAAAKFIENSLAKAIPVVIGFLAALLGVTGISAKIKSIIEKIRKPINTAIDWVIQRAVRLVKATGKLLGFGKKDKAGEEVPTNPKWNDAVAHIHTDIAKMQADGLTEEEMTNKVPIWKNKYGFSELTLIIKGEEYELNGAMSPKKNVGKGKLKAGFPTGTKNDPIPIKWYKSESDYPTIGGKRPSEGVDLRIGKDYQKVKVAQANFIKKEKVIQKSSEERPDDPIKDRVRDALKVSGAPKVSISDYQIDHVKDLQWYGGDTYNNLWPLAAEKNRGANSSYYQRVKIKGDSELHTVKSLGGKYFWVAKVVSPTSGHDTTKAVNSGKDGVPVRKP